MACIIQIKDQSGFHIFNSREEAVQYIKNHNLELKSFINSKGETETVLIENVGNVNKQIINKASEISYAETKNDLGKMKNSGWDCEEYKETSKSWSMSELLKHIKKEVNGEMKRLFPEFIQHNYLNVLSQSEIIRHYLSIVKKIDVDKISQEDVDLERRRIFDEDENITRDTLQSSSYWYNIISSKLNLTKEEKDKFFTEDLFKEIDASVKEENLNNFKLMIAGEYYHKVLEIYIKKPKASLDDVIKELDNKFKESLHKKYDNYEDVDNADLELENVISSLEIDQISSSIKKAISNINKHFISNGAKSIEFLSEKRITCDLKEPVGNKTSVRGKIDLIALVDGVPYIIDLKTSSKKYVDWHSEKTLKTKYQLAAYRKMLEKIGCDFRGSGSNTYIYNIHLNEEDGKFNDANDDEGLHYVDVSSDNTIYKNIDDIFGKIEPKNLNADKDRIAKIDHIIEETFDISSEKGRSKQQKQVSKDNIRVIKRKDKVFLLYYLYKPDGSQYNKEQEVVVEPGKTLEESIEIAKDKIADIINKNSSEKFSGRYGFIVNNLKDFISGQKTLKDFSESMCIDDPERRLRVEQIFFKYGKDCKIIESEWADKYKLILIETPSGIDVICCSDFDPFIAHDVTDKNAKLLSKLPMVLNDTNIKNIGNVNIMIGALVINEIFENIQSDPRRKSIGEIISLDVFGMKGYKMSTSDLKRNFKAIKNNFSSDIEDNISVSITDPFIRVYNDFHRFLLTISDETTKDGIWKKIKFKLDRKLSDEKSSNDFDSLRSIKSLDEFISSISDKKITTKDRSALLLSIKKTLENEYPDHFTGSRISDEITLLADTIEMALAINENRELNFEQDISKYGFNSGSMFVSLDLIPSHNARIIHRIVNDGFDKIHSRFNKFNEKFRTRVNALKEDKKYDQVEALTIGYTSRIYSNMFRMENGQLKNGDLILKDFKDSSLSLEESRFLKFVLYNLNKYKYNKLTLENIDTFDFKESDYYFPLIRNKGLINRIKDGGGVSVDNLKSWWNKQRNDALQMKDTLEGTMQERNKVQQEFDRVYNEFHKRSDVEYRKELIERNGLDAFSRDIETAMSTFIVAMESQNIFDNEVLPKVKGIVYSLEMMGSISGNKLDNLKEFIEKYITSSVHNDSIIDKEVQKIMPIVGAMKGVAASVALSFNIVNLPRELLMGFFNNISRAMFKTYGKETYTLKDYMSAWGIMHVDAFKFVTTVTKIELLNEHFHMSNMSLTDIPEQTTSNKTGINSLFNRFMTWTVTAPDYWNRMTMFIAQMIHDGTWDAYSVKQDGDEVSLIYDMSKDERFKTLVRYKGDIKNVPRNDVERFNREKALYEVMREDMRNETDDPITDPSTNSNNTTWFLTRAYTNRQRDSLKSFADLSFGYYDKEVKAEFFKTAVGGVFKQFMSYMTAKKSQYFQTGTTDTARGDYTQLKNSKGELIYKNTEDGSYITEEDYNKLKHEDENKMSIYEPAMGWTGSYLEGIAQSYVHLCKQLYKGVKEMAAGKGTGILQEMWNEYGKAGHIRHSNLLQGIWDLAISTALIKLIYMMFFDDPDKTGKSYEKQLKDASWHTQTGLAIISGAARDFNIAASLGNALFTWEIPALGIFENVGKSFWNAIGDEDLSLAEKLWVPTVKSFGIFRAIRPLAYEAEKD